MNYVNLRAEMARKGITQKQMAAALGMSEVNFNGKLNGRTRITVDEAKRIRNTFFSDNTLDYLFYSDIDDVPVKE